MSLTRKIANNTLIQISGRIISVALGLAVLAIMTRDLGPVGFGYLTTILAFLQFFAILADLGLNLTTIQLISEPGADQEKIINNLVSFRAVSALIFLAAAPIIAISFPYPAIVKWGIALTTFSFFFTVLQQILVGLFQKELQTLKTVIADLGGRIVSLLIMLISIKLGWGLWGVLASLIFSNLINLIILFGSAKSLLKINWEIDLAIWKKIIYRTWPLALTVIFNLVYFKADTIILSIFKPATDVGLYGAPYKILEVLIQFPYLFLGLILPLLTSAWAVKDLPYFKKIFQASFDFLIIAAAPIIVGAWWLAKPIIMLIAGEAFLKSADLLRVLILAVGIIFISSLYGYAIVAANQQKKMIRFYIIAALFALAGYLIFIPLYSYWGAAYMTVAVELIIALAAGLTVKRITGVSADWRIAGKVILACLAMSAVLLLIRGWNIFLSISFGALSYFIALYATGGLDKRIIKEILMLEKE